MIYTTRFAHFESAPKWKAGDKIKRGDIIGIMGNSGDSTGKHLHLDSAEGVQLKPYHLYDYDESIKPSPRQCLLFIDDELFGTELEVTTAYAEFEYFTKRKKVHHGFDVVPKNRKPKYFDIHWNRSMEGTVVLVLDDPAGYGHCIYIAYDA